MPTTINGVGTHYYGHKNADRRSGTCRSCGRGVTLESYDTRLWFVVVYIPIIPLGRKRIIDQCPACKRHYVADADQWETQKQLNVSGALERYHADPTPEHAIEAHQQLLNFHQTGEAAELRRQMAEQFRQNAKVQAYLGMALTGMGLAGDGLIYYQRAFELRPDLPEARVGLAYDHMRAGRLAEARTLLDFLEKPGAVQLYSLEPIETLADAYGRAGFRAEALALYRVLLDGLPQIGEIAAFRNKVKSLEKVVGQPTMLPKQKFSWKRIFARKPSGRQAPRSPVLTWRGLATVGAIALAITGIVVFHHIYEQRHRPLYIVNAFKEPATVEVRGVGTVHAGWRPERLELKEGHYHAVVSGPVKEEFDFDIQPAPGARWSNDPLWVLNVGGEALLLETQATYRASSPPPPTLRPHFGRQVERVDHVTNPFTALPETVEMKSNESRTLTQLERFSGAPADLIAHFQSTGRNPEALQLAEWRLRRHPDDQNALFVFVGLADTKRAEDFLHAGLARRPVAIPWHRLYQNLHNSAAWRSWLTVEYNAMLQADPKNASLLYLRGRIASDPAEAESWYKQAREQDPRNPYPAYALAYHCASRGDWEGARPLFASAAELQPEQAEFVSGIFECRLALQDYAGLEQEIRARLAKNAQDVTAAEQLVDVLAAQNRNTEAQGVMTNFTKAVARLNKQASADLNSYLRRHLLYATGNFDALAADARNDRSPAGRRTYFTALVEQGKMEEAVRLHPLDEPKATDPYHFLAVSLAWVVAHEPKRADEWFRRGVALLDAGSAEDARAAALLAGKAEISSEQIKALSQVPKGKGILLTCLGVMHPEKRAELFAAARTMNVDRDFPYQLIRRITAESH